MAPALSIAPRESQDPEQNAPEDADKPPSVRRRALASVDNLTSHMEDEDMGLQSQPSLAKDSQEMEQILVDLGNSDIAQADLLQAIKTLESGGDTLSTGDTDAIFPLSGFELPDVADSEGDGVEDRIKATQARLEKRCAFLQRRLRILQARTIGKRISEEAAQTFDKCTRGARRDGAGRPVSLKTFLKTVETTASLQASAASRTVVGPKYFNPGTSKGEASRSASAGIPSGTLAGLEDTAGALRSHLSVVKHELDSDATASSSGAESNDEAVTYNNPHQQPMPIEKRALWSYQRARASIASRWCWLQAQVQELEYKIRQHSDLHKKVRDAKGAVEFENQPSTSTSLPTAYQGSLPGAEPADDDPATETCARVRPLKRETFKKRKLLQMHGLHVATTKAAKPSDIRCSCLSPEEGCPVCTGRAEPTQPAAPFSTLARPQRIAAVDPGYHPVLSDLKDVSPSLHVAALASRGWFRPRASKGGRGSHAPLARAPPPSTPALKQPRKHPTRLKRGRPPLSRKIRERERHDEETTSGHERSRCRSSTESRAYRRQSYDIDNIVIPSSVAANTRPQILTYKQIITPKWRVLDAPETPLNNGVSKANRMSMEESEDEDVSEAAVADRHRRAERSERERYTRKQRARRTQHHEATAEQPPEPVMPPPQDPVPQMSQVQVRPYSPRQFPLPEWAYSAMLASMPSDHRPPSPPAPPSPLLEVDEVDGSSSLSPMSPLVFDGDDPDDAEWDPSSEKVKYERRKSSFR